MTKTNKKGSSRRKGDEYQDLTALRLVLENYIDRKPFKIFLEYEDAGKLDDIVLFQGTEIFACQVKYAVNPLDVYEHSNFTDPESPVNFRKFSDSWNAMREKFLEHRLTACLFSNRALGPALVKLLTDDGNGAFRPEVIEDRKRGEAKELRSLLKSASGLDSDSFREFLKAFRFRVRQPTLEDLEQHIKTFLLDKKLGFSDTAIFFYLKEAVKNHAIFSRDPITPEWVDELLQRFRSNLRVPQVFPVNHKHFVERKSLSDQLDKALPEADGGYLVVTGLPGSGKSTSLTEYFNALDPAKYEILRYYCFVGINDNDQKMRVKAKTLRANLLNEFQDKYPSILERRFDYGEQNFYKCLNTLGQFFIEQGKRFVIFLDGLDHAERFGREVTDTVISTLPPDVPGGVTFVVSTQELRNWPHFLRRARECPGTHIQMPLFSRSETQDYLENKREIQGLSNADIADIHRKCEGLPLYLQYAAEVLLSAEAVPDAVESLAPATDGNIQNYYRLLWEELDRAGASGARHLCGVMACLRFSLNKGELYSIQRSLSRPQFEDAYKLVSHLLRHSEDRMSVFHNSFREFVISQLDNDWLKEIKKNIADFLKTSKDSPKWFGHVFEYCYELGDYAYVLEEVNANFIDRALLSYRPSEEILDAMDWALESAFKAQDIVELSRIGSLKYRTQERLESYLDRTLLADALIALGREKDVISFAYSSQTDCWMVDSRTSLAVISALADIGERELGRRLFGAFMDEFEDVDQYGGEELHSQVTGIARCLGIYPESLACSLRWLSSFELTPGTLQIADSYAPEYAPHLSAYIDALVKFEHTEKWNRLKRVKKLFPNRLVRYLLIRALARYGLLEDLRTALMEYVEQESPCGNVELAFYAAKAGMPASDVSAIAGLIEAPETNRTSSLRWKDPILRHYAYSFIVLAYEDNEGPYANLCETVGISQMLWTSALRHLLKACRCIAMSFRNDTNNWYADACESIDLLAHAEQGKDERIVELIDIVRALLPFTIGLLTEEVRKRFPDKLDSWFEKLASLRNSLLWNTHFGISEYREDYEFELNLWDTLAENSMVRTKLASILKSCAATYEKSTMLKGDNRSSHFMRLAAIMAKCGMREDAERWLSYGVHSSLIYGYHKDITLSYLIDILKLVNKRYPEKALERCTRVLRMVGWMPHLTDGRETKWFPEMAFSAVLEVDRQAAFKLFEHFSQAAARWQMEDCLKEYILSAVDGDPEYLWCLSESLFDDPVEARQHLVNLVGKSCSEDVRGEFENRFRHFLRTEISPRRWPDFLKEEFSILPDSDEKSENDTGSSGYRKSDFMLDGKTVTGEDVVEKCKASFSEFLTIFEKLENQNEHFYEADLRDSVLRHHIQEAVSRDTLLLIMEYAELQKPWFDSGVMERLADRFSDLGDQDNAIKCLGMAYVFFRGFYRGPESIHLLSSIARVNRVAAEGYLLQKCCNSARGSEGGYDTPIIAALGLDVLDKSSMLEAVFENFLTHCESMFAQMPEENNYSWLKNSAVRPFNENQLILEFAVNELGTPDIDRGNKLIRALAKLAVARPQSAVPMLVSKTLSASGRLFRRLLMILHVVASWSPHVLAPHQRTLVKLLDREDFLCRQSTVRIFRCISLASALESAVAEAVEDINRKYSTAISHSTYRMQSNPSSVFQEFLNRNTLFHFSDQLTLIEKILQVKPGSLAAAVEERLDLQNWSMDEEKSRLEDNWDGKVHPRGWPVAWITTEFQELVAEMVWDILDEAVEKLKLDAFQVNYLWKTIQLVDPEHVLDNRRTRPSDIEPLRVADKEEWFGELEAVESFRVANTRNLQQDTCWVTVFEDRALSQEEKYNVPYRQTMLQRAVLIPRQVYGGSHKVDELEVLTERILPESEMALTLEQASNILMERGKSLLDIGDECIPLVAEHQNPKGFFGYWSICTLTSFIIDEFNLSFEGFNLIKNGETIAKYESWQEGCHSEEYNREKLSFGVRLQVRLDFLTEVCDCYQKMLCVLIKETRAHYKSISERKPDALKDSKRYVLYHL